MENSSASASLAKDSTTVLELESIKGSSVASSVHLVNPSKAPSIKESWYVLLMSILIAFGGFIFGYDIGTISGYVNMPDYLQRFGEQSQLDPSVYYCSNSRVGLIVSIMSLGSIVGGLTLAKYADIGGRRRSIVLALIIYIVSIVIQITSLRSWIQMMMGRLVEGFSLGSISITCPMLISESAPSRIRGICVFFYQFMATFGIFIGYSVNYGASSLEGSKLWRAPMGICFAWAIILLLGILIIPESPRFLVNKQRYEEAMKSLAKLARTTIDNPKVKSELDAIVAAAELERAIGQATWKEIFVGKPRILYRVMIGILIQTAQQLTGANYFFYYGTTIFKAVGLSDSFLTSIILGAVNLATTFIGLAIIDRYGRRVVCLVGTSGMFVCFLIYSILGSQKLYLEDGTTSIPVGNAMIFLTCLFIAFFAPTWGGIPNVITSEIFPGRVRSIGMSICIANLWLWNFITNFTTPFITSAIDFYYGFIFAGFLLCSLFFVYFCVYETKGLSLEEVDEMFSTKIKAWQSPLWHPASKTIKEEELQYEA